MREYEKHERKDEIVDRCLSTFMKHGLFDTTSKNLCDALNMNSGAVFYYFKSKNDIVIACAEEAKKRIERDLFGIAIDDLEEPEKLAKDLYERATVMQPLMKFFISVCTTPKYDKAMRQSLDNLNIRYQKYVEEIANKLCVSSKDVAPYVYITVNMMLSYMLFGETSFTAPQYELVYGKLVSILEKNKVQKERKAK